MRHSAIDLFMVQLCEEAREVTNEIRSRMPEIPWSAIAETRTFFVHVYSAVNPNMAWDSIEGDLPGLREACERCIAEIELGEYVPSFNSRTAEMNSENQADGSSAEASEQESDPDEG